jgi:hypothetical protein
MVITPSVTSMYFRPSPGYLVTNSCGGNSVPSPYLRAEFESRLTTNLLTTNLRPQIFESPFVGSQIPIAVPLKVTVVVPRSEVAEGGLQRG